MVYLFVLVFLIICASLFDRNVDKRLKKFFYIAAYIVLILLMTLRFRVGGDVLYYENTFPFMPSLAELGSMNLFEQTYQPLWYVLNAVVKSVYDDFTFFQFVHALIVNTAIFFLIPRYTKLRFLGVLVYYIFFYLYFNTEILREALAVVIFLFAYPLIFKKKYIQYFLLCIVAFLFHAFAAFIFFVPLLVFVFRKPINIATTLIIMVLVVAAPTIIMPLILKVFSFNEAVERQFKFYSELEINLNGILKSLFDAIPVLLVIIMQKSKKNVDPILISAANIYFVLILLSMTMAGASRLSNYFVFFFFMLAINTLFTDRKATISFFRIQFIVIVLVLMVSKVFYYMRDMSKYNYRYPARFYNRYLPYHSIFDPQIDRTRESIFNNSMEENFEK